MDDLDEVREGETGEAGEEQEGGTGEAGTEEAALLNKEEPDENDLEEVEVETAKYLITGLVNRMDGDTIVDQYPVGSEEVLPVAFGDQQVENGQATKVE